MLWLGGQGRFDSCLAHEPSDYYLATGEDEMRLRAWLTLAWLVLPTYAAAQSSNTVADARCAALNQPRLSGASVIVTQFHPAGPYVAPDAPSPPAKPSPFTAPAHCRVTVIARPTADSEIEVAVWLPLSWNGKLLAVGNGAWGGVMNYESLLSSIRDGYATVATDTGHKGLRAGPSWAIGHPEKLVDFGSRAVHEMAVHGKSLVAAFYARPARYSYFSGCSTGGRQGLVAAQRYPRDFDGIVAGAPVTDQARLRGADVALLLPGIVDPAKALTASKVELVHKAIVNACDAQDGVSDGIVDDPRSCKVDLHALACKGTDAADCLTAGQLETVMRSYAPVVTRAGQVLSPGKWPGSVSTSQPPFTYGRNPIGRASPSRNRRSSS
jgi:hypothetical protein